MAQTFSHGYALLVGVGATAYSPWSLPVTVKDLQAVRKVLTEPTLCGYPDDDQHVRLLHDQTATRAAILDALAWLKAQAAADPEATAVVFYSGHGWLDEATCYYLIPHDVKPHNIPGSAYQARTSPLRCAKSRHGGCWPSSTAVTRRAWQRPRRPRPRWICLPD